MLQDLGWRSLEQRRADARLILLYKIHHGHVPINASKYLRPMTRRTRHSHSDSYIPLLTSTSSHRLSFYPRTVSLRASSLVGRGAGEEERRREIATMSQEFEYLRRKIRRKMLIGGDFIWLLLIALRVRCVKRQNKVGGKRRFYL